MSKSHTEERLCNKNICIFRKYKKQYEPILIVKSTKSGGLHKCPGLCILEQEALTDDISSSVLYKKLMQVTCVLMVGISC